jgi:hypothetical protein
MEKKNEMREKFYDVKVDELTNEQCRELLREIDSIVSDMPSFTDVRNERTSIWDPYTCCSGHTNEGHDDSCPVGKLKRIFGWY